MRDNRSLYIYFGVVLVGVIFILRLFQIQVLDDKYANAADRISLRKQTVYPQRGLIFDRHENLLVYNDPLYDLMLSVPIRISNIDTTSFCKLLEIDRAEFDKRLNAAKRNSFRGKAIFKKNISNLVYARLQERLYEFKGFFFEIRQDRNYKYNSAAHLLGYLGEVSRKQLDRQVEEYYEQGDFNGKKGVERFYEKELRGVKGEQYFYVDKHGLDRGSYKDKKLDKEVVDGKNLYLSIDIELQKYGEKLLANKLGSVVAIEPSTGEILALISSPFYNPVKFNIQNRGSYYNAAINDPTKPIFNRAVSAPYPPGSTFKPVMALVGLQDGAITKNTYFGCRGYYKLGRRTIACHYHSYNTSLQKSIASSCNTYYCNIFKNMMQSGKYENTEEAYNSWRRYMRSFGIGGELGIDVSVESRGWLRDAAYYDRMYGEDKWSYARIISLSFGQGELGLTPVQMANVAATIANRGHYYIPHVVRRIENQDSIPTKYVVKNHTLVDPKHFDAVIQGMQQVTRTGTASAIAIKGIDIAGKTGTVQNPHGKNHSAYIAFAPADNPKIAIAVVVEEAGYGATWAAPIAHLVIEKYLSPDTLEVSSRASLEKKIIKSNLIPYKYRTQRDMSLYAE
ncbi:MAG: penicillin-binding protein 2 [Bacteroidia bacterium]